MILFCTVLILAAAVFAYGKGSKWVPLLLLFPYLGLSIYLAYRVIHPCAPVGFWTLIAVGAGFPLLTLAVVTADMRWGLFCLDTFFGIAFVALLPPILLIGNTVAILARAVGA